MTTIAWDGTTLAGDTLAGQGNLKRQVVKVWRLHDGRLYGGAGEYQSVLEVKAWLEAGDPEDKKPPLDDFAAMVIDCDGHCYRLEGRLIFMPIAEPYHAIGSGRDFALAAMALSVCAVTAVEVASQFDIYTSSEVTTVTLQSASRDPLVKGGLTKECKEYYQRYWSLSQKEG